MLRRQLPVHSPLSGRALTHGLRSALSGDQARDRVRCAIRERYSARSVLLTDSGTSALRLALAAASSRSGPAALPAYSCYDLATAADGAGVEGVLYDLRPGTLAPEPDSLRQALDGGVSALVVAPLYGVPIDMDFVRNAAEEAGALLVEDAAQGVGAAWHGRSVGSWGDLSVLSFGRGKGITGGGGALLAHTAASEQVVERAESRLGPPRWGGKELVRSFAQWFLGRPTLYALPASLPFIDLGETVYHQPNRPTGMPGSCAGLLSRTLELADEEARCRRRQAAYLLRMVDSSPGMATISVPDGGESGWLRLPVLVNRRARQSGLSGRDARSLGIMPGYPKSLAQLSGFRQRCRNAGDPFPGAIRLSSSLFTLPTHTLLTERDLHRIVTILRRDS